MKEPFVFVNGVKVNLLEDCRIALYKTFPHGSVLYDLSCVPPSLVTLGEGDDNGISFTKLRPMGHYAAYARDQHTGTLFVPLKQYVCVYVTNLPFTATAELLYRCLEPFGSVKEADVFRGKDTPCDGRGYAVMSKTEKLAVLPSAIQIQNKHFVYVEISDCLPPQTKHFLYHTPNTTTPLPRRAHNVTNGSRESSVLLTNLPQPRSSITRLTKMGAVPPAPAALPIGTSGSKGGRDSNATSGETYFYTVYANERDLQEQTIRTTPINEVEFYYSLENRGNVILIFLLQESGTVYGCARLVPKREGTMRDGLCSVDWLRRGVYLSEDRPPILTELNCRDGTLLKNNVGGRIVDVLMESPSLDYPPEPLPRYGADRSPPPPPVSSLGLASLSLALYLSVSLFFFFYRSELNCSLACVSVSA
ncbi:hypothetical protein STCU_06539 [Strigomonas culicis]|uniref:RRM domain-containing protein n=1 Tax=Strigomonas culicis TaxID=28005 RepID=S9UAD7_9TRYP|nr:hypothetical protein STCU_06539 [Strigomonas culicis]|eukprot:EPY25704.1 hypothetical protein STCU_06539 [Strigomonas culicis]